MLLSGLITHRAAALMGTRGDSLFHGGLVENKRGEEGRDGKGRWSNVGPALGES